jgi:hypothetical protein
VNVPVCPTGFSFVGEAGYNRLSNRWKRGVHGPIDSLAGCFAVSVRAGWPVPAAAAGAVLAGAGGAVCWAGAGGARRATALAHADAHAHP